MTTVRCSFEQQYQALRSGAGYVELDGWSSVTFTGADRQSFLNSFCTNDVKKLTPGQNCEAFVTNVKGRTIGYGVVDCRQEELVFITVPKQAAPLIEHFERYIIREKVHLRDTSGERVYFHGTSLPAVPLAQWIDWNLLGRKSAGLLEVATTDVAKVHQYLHERNYTPGDMASFEALRIEAGTPLFGVDFNVQNLPQEVGRDREAISFTKGCYLGQETVARIDALGHVNQRLVGVRFFGRDVPDAGMELFAGNAKVGRVTSATFSPRLAAPLALAMLRREANAPGARLESRIGPCEVVKPPLAN